MKDLAQFIHFIAVPCLLPSAQVQEGRRLKQNFLDVFRQMPPLPFSENQDFETVMRVKVL